MLCKIQPCTKKIAYAWFEVASSNSSMRFYGHLGFSCPPGELWVNTHLFFLKIIKMTSKGGIMFIGRDSFLRAA